MNKVTFNEYYAKQAEFLSKHDCRMYQEGDCNYYSKHWYSEDGAEMYEVNRIRKYSEATRFQLIQDGEVIAEC